MADLAQMERALRNADAAGDTEAARTIAQAIKAEQSGGIGQTIGNVAAGALRGAGSIGATLLYPIDKATDLIKGDRGPSITGLVTGKQPLSRNEERRQQMDAALQTMGAQPDSMGYTLGKLGGEIAGTAGMGGVLANSARAIPMLANSAKAAPLIDAIGSAGFSAGGMTGKAGLAVRAAGGAVTGGASAGMVNPGDAGMGAGIGAVLPGAVMAAGKIGHAVALGVRNMRNPSQLGAQELERALGILNPQERAEAIQKLQAAQELVPGSRPTVAQALQTPEASITQRVVYDTPGASTLRDTLARQAEARSAALEGVAPTNANGAAEARADTGAAIARFARAEEAQAQTANRLQYGSVDPARQSATVLPAQAMRDSAETFIGPGAVGKNQIPRAFAKEAEALSAPTTTPASLLVDSSGQPFTAAASTARGSPWDEVMRMRSSLNEQWSQAREKGDKQAAAAIAGQLESLDVAVRNQLPPDMLARWTEANASHAALMQRFHTGPQSTIFQTRNGEPAAQGAEVAGKFWGARPGVAEDVQSFRRLVDDNPATLGQFRSMVTTEGAGTADAAGNLTTKFSKWVKQTLPGLRETFSPAEVKTLQGIAQDIDRAASAQKLGTSLGGSNTYQNSANALNLGMLDSAALSKAANMIPGVRLAAAPLLESARSSMRNAKAERLSGLLSDSELAAQALGLLGQPIKPLRIPGAGLLGRSLPVLLADQ